MNLIEEIQNNLATELGAINQLIATNLAVEEEMIGLIGNYLTKAGGKKIRPILTILAAKLFQPTQTQINNALKLATSIELIHMATLLHDDVIDGSKLRRFIPTANSVWGSKASILVGDFLFSQSFKLIVSTKSIAALEVLSNASAIIAQGEVMQLAKLQQQQLIDQATYYKVINDKTAELFAAACQVGGIVATAEAAHIAALKQFGQHLGTIFQITDDILDYLHADANQTGKYIGDDFYEGKVTLPIIILLDKLSEADKQQLITLLAQPQRTSANLLWVKELLNQHRVIDDIEITLLELKSKALACLAHIDVHSAEQQYLLKLVDFAINRIKQ